MGFFDRVMRIAFHNDGYGYGWTIDGDSEKQAGQMGFRAGILAESQRAEERRREKLAEIPRHVNSTWLWTGDRWSKWSTVWKTYDEVDQTTVPTPLLELLGEHGVTPVAGDRFRFTDDGWVALDPGDPDDLPAGNDDGMDDDLPDPWRDTSP